MSDFRLRHFCWSLSARRAWIEIKYVVKDSDFSGVALRKESVDRNLSAMQIVIIVVESLSARRAWIEMTYDGLIASANFVALRKESVDRNLSAMQIVIIVVGRSPQGERG